MEEKALKKSWKNWTARPARNPGSTCTLGQRALSLSMQLGLST